MHILTTKSQIPITRKKLCWCLLASTGRLNKREAEAVMMAGGSAKHCITHKSAFELTIPPMSSSTGHPITMPQTSTLFLRVLHANTIIQHLHSTSIAWQLFCHLKAMSKGVSPLISRMLKEATASSLNRYHANGLFLTRSTCDYVQVLLQELSNVEYPNDLHSFFSTHFLAFAFLATTFWSK